MRKRARNRIIIILGLVLIVLAAAALIFRDRLIPGVAGTASQFETAAVVRGSLAETVGQSGNVRPGQSATLAWKSSGKIGEVLAEVGQLVAADDVLARLDRDSLPANLLLAQGELIAAQQAMDNLRENQTAQANARAELVKAQKEVEDAQKEIDLLDLPNASPANLEGAQAGLNLAQAQLNQAEQLYSLFEGRPEDDVQRLQAAAQLERARKQLRNAEWNLTYAQSKPNQAAADQANSRIAVAQASLQEAQKEWERVKNGPTRDDLDAAQARIDAAQKALSAREIKAPFNGTITQVFARQGDIIRPETAAFRLDDLTQLTIKVNVPEIDINRVKTGQLVTINFDAIRGRGYLGRVISISTIGIAQQGNISFPVTVQLVDQDEQVKPGMTASVSIIVQQVEDVLMVPNRGLRFTSNGRVVYLLRDGQQVMLPVLVGISDDLNTQITSDNLQEGDLIILNPVIETPAP